jgi:hypothetical protein
MQISNFEFLFGGLLQPRVGQTMFIIAQLDHSNSPNPLPLSIMIPSPSENSNNVLEKKTELPLMHVMPFQDSIAEQKSDD